MVTLVTSLSDAELYDATSLQLHKPSKVSKLANTFTSPCSVAFIYTSLLLLFLLFLLLLHTKGIKNITKSTG
jgi:hypothetical protein